METDLRNWTLGAAPAGTPQDAQAAMSATYQRIAKLVSATGTGPYARGFAITLYRVRDPAAAQVKHGAAVRAAMDAVIGQYRSKRSIGLIVARKPYPTGGEQTELEFFTPAAGETLAQTARRLRQGLQGPQFAIFTAPNTWI